MLTTYKQNCLMLIQFTLFKYFNIFFPLKHDTKTLPISWQYLTNRRNNYYWTTIYFKSWSLAFSVKLVLNLRLDINLAATELSAGHSKLNWRVKMKTIFTESVRSLRECEFHLRVWLWQDFCIFSCERVAARRRLTIGEWRIENAAGWTLRLTHEQASWRAYLKVLLSGEKCIFGNQKK